MKISLLLPLCALAFLSTSVFAEEGDQLQGKIKELEERARNAKEQGRSDEAQELVQHVRRLQAEIGEREGQRGGGDKLEMAKRKIAELHQAGKHDEAEQLERRLHEAAGKRADGERKEGGGDAERREHVMAAIKHLHAAGLHEPAERIEQMLRENREKSAQPKREEAREPGGADDLRRGLREMHEQMGKMARAIEELRQQVGKQHAEGEPRKDR